MARVSRKFYEALKTSDRPNYRIAQDAGLSPSLLSKILHGCEEVRVNDRRVLAVGRILGLSPGDCFEQE